MISISVISPVYNTAEYLHGFIKSVLDQTVPDFELILVDDGSPDQCGEICDTYAAKDSRITVIHQKNSGVSAARNAGTIAAKGAYVTFIDSDDYIEVDYLRVLFSLAEKYQADISIVSLFAYDSNCDVLDDLSEIVYDSAAKAVQEIGAQHNYKFRTCCAKLTKKQMLAYIRK